MNLEKRADILFVEDIDPQEIVQRITAHQVGVIDWGDPENMIFCIIGDSSNLEVTRRMNRIKGRPEDKTLAVAGYAGMVEKVADLQSSKALIRICENRGLNHSELIPRLFSYPVGLILPAKETLSEAIVQINKQGQKTVMVAGQSQNPNYDYHDLYNQVEYALDEVGIVIAGTSANRNDNEVYTVYQQERAYQELSKDVDFFIQRRILHPRYRNKKMTSCTAFDLTSERVVIKRGGSKRIDRFRDHFGEIHVSENFEVLPGAEMSFAYVQTQATALLQTFFPKTILKSS